VQQTFSALSSRMCIKTATGVGPSSIRIAYEEFGENHALPVLLMMGAGAPLLHWPDGFGIELTSQGLRPIRFDNRDAGLSSHFSDAPVPDFPAALAGDRSSASYNLSDMAADTIGLLDTIELESAHFLCGSLGGFIAHTIAIEHPRRVRSLTSIMSTEMSGIVTPRGEPRIAPFPPVAPL